MPLPGQQKTRSGSPAGGLALAAFVKRPQADAQIGAGGGPYRAAPIPSTIMHASAIGAC